MPSINDLLKAAEYLDKNEQQNCSLQSDDAVDHDVVENEMFENEEKLALVLASSATNNGCPARSDAAAAGASTSSGDTSRGSSRNQIEKNKHTEIEKKRRAYLRSRLDRLKVVVPSDRNAARFTIHRLLIKSKEHIQTLERRALDYEANRDKLKLRNTELKNRMQELLADSRPSGGQCKVLFKSPFYLNGVRRPYTPQVLEPSKTLCGPRAITAVAGIAANSTIKRPVVSAASSHHFVSNKDDPTISCPTKRSVGSFVDPTDQGKRSKLVTIYPIPIRDPIPQTKSIFATSGPDDLLTITIQRSSKTSGLVRRQLVAE